MLMTRKGHDNSRDSGYETSDSHNPQPSGPGSDRDPASSESAFEQSVGQGVHGQGRPRVKHGSSRDGATPFGVAPEKPDAQSTPPGRWTTDPKKSHLPAGDDYNETGTVRP